ncbi:histone acetyltransferase [Proteus hauseri ATCC 700826]|uniref:Histone acetyltransferase n=1 Tax=Proteus hauseri ATCC 700826 TaxID=1354271 RepID=A0AAJ3HRS6_PROHU|nr:N-acetyltransferase [Proteus hauseri]OAT46607.1 histone acetyltransferase [Proteus hauseri ATCC 700826]
MQSLNEHYMLRAATQKDTAEIIQLFTLAFSRKLHAFHIDRTIPNQQHQLEAIWNEQARKPNQVQFVVTDANAIVATFCLAIKESRFKTSEFTKTPVSKHWEYGIINYIKQQIFFSLFNYEPNKQEAYLSHIAVSPAYQGKGIASLILKWIFQYSKNNLKKNYLSLYVDTKHTGAIHLYKKSGFNIKKKESSLITQSFFNIKQWYYMSQKL